jgi:hypothetical protein
MLSRIGTFIRQVLYFLSHNGKAFSCLTGTGRFHSCIERKKISLEGNIFNRLNNPTNLLGCLGNIFHSGCEILHLLVAVFQLDRCIR